MIELFRRKPQWRSFETDVAHYGALQQHDAGPRSVALEQIVGSLNGYRVSVPRAGAWHVLSSNQRYRQIRELMSQGHTFEAVELYALDGVYYIVDGNHRVAAACSLGQLAIDAQVIEFRPVNGRPQESAA
jgi:hypothetical protein